MKSNRLRSGLAAALALTVLGSMPVRAAESQAELRQSLQDLLDWWPGDYDSLPQVDAERRLGAPPDGEHDRQTRVFRRVAVPHIGEHVIYGEVHVGGKDGDIIPGQQVLYIMHIDAARRAIDVSGRRILNGDRFRLKDQTPEKLRDIAIDPNVGGNCHFLWRREGLQLVAHLSDLNANNTTCTMVSKTSGQKMTWDAKWILTPDQMWVFDNGYLHDQDNPSRPPRLFAGREDRSFEKMYKGREFKCEIRATGGARLAVGIADHGGEVALGSNFAAEPMTLQLLRSEYQRASGVGLEYKLRLALLPAGSDQPVAQALETGDARRVTLNHQGIQAACKH